MSISDFLLGRAIKFHKKVKNNKGQSLTLLGLLPLSACASDGQSVEPVQPEVLITSDGVVTGTSGNDVVDLSNSSQNLQVTAHLGDDVVQTGSGNDFVDASGGNDIISTGKGDDEIFGRAGDDFIWAGEGADSIDAGYGNDFIIILGTTLVDEYSGISITNSADNGLDLSEILDLSDINDHSVSDIADGEEIDGGVGVDTIVIYGEVDLTGVNISSVEQMWVNSSVTITADQLNNLQSVIGDGTSEVIVEAGDSLLDVNLANLNFEGVKNLEIKGDAKITIGSDADLSDLQSISATGNLEIEISPGSDTVNLSTITSISPAASVVVPTGASLTIDSAPTEIVDIRGGGTITLSPEILNDPEALAKIIVDDSVILKDENGAIIDPADTGIKVITYLAEGDDSLPEISFSIIELAENESAEQAFFSVQLNARSLSEVTVAYTLSDGTAGTVTFAPGEAEHKIAVTWADDQIAEADETVAVTLTTATNATITGATATLTITNDDLPTGLTGFSGSMNYTEGDGAVVIDGDVIFSDEYGAYSGGSLTVSGHSSDETIAIRHQGTDAGQIGVDGTNITYGGVSIATLAGGTAGVSLTVTFNASAGVADIDALIQNLTYENTSDTPNASSSLSLTLTSNDGSNVIAIGGTAYSDETWATNNPFDATNLYDANWVLIDDLYANQYNNLTPTFVDFDGDGDMDLVVGQSGGTLHYYLNTEVDGKLTYVEQTGTANPFNGISVDNYSTPAFVDLNGDGNMDLVVGLGNMDFVTTGGVTGTFRYYLSTEVDGEQTYVEQTGTANPFNGIDFGYNASPDFADLDGDGDMDLVLGARDGTLRYYLNTGTSTAPTYVAQTGTANPFNGLDVGQYSTPTFIDADGDGDMDLVVGDGFDTFGNEWLSGTLHYYENTGSTQSPVYTERTGSDNPFAGLLDNFESYIGYFAPAFGDVDGDGDQDLVVGTYSGEAIYFQNDSTFTVSLTAVNDAPLGADKTVTTDEDVVHTFAVTDFDFSDIEGDSLVSIRIDTLPSVGALMLNDAAVTAGQVITASDIPNLSFTPDQDEFGRNYTSLTFSVNDGTDWSEGSNTLTIDVNGPPPTITVANVFASEADETMSVIVTLSHEYHNTVTVDYTLPGGTQTTLTFEPWVTEMTIPITWDDDETIEKPEVRNIEFANPVNSHFLDSQGGEVTTLNSTAIINDDDDPGLIYLWALPESEVSAGEVTSGHTSQSYDGAIGSVELYEGSAYVLYASNTGDINGDGYADLITGNKDDDSFDSTVTIYLGPNAPSFGSSYGEFNSVPVASLTGHNSTGWDLSILGDINGDGFDDIIASGYYGNEAYVLFGRENISGSFDGPSLTGEDGFVFSGGREALYTGIGDFNGDGYEDFAFYELSGSIGYVVLGSATIATDSIDFDGTNSFRIDNNDRVAFSYIGDVNGDGLDDLGVTAFYGGTNYILYGKSSNENAILGTTDSETLSGTTAADEIIAGQGDDTLQGNGGADVLYGGDGDDRIVVTDLNFFRVDGDKGTDTLVLDGEDMELDLRAINLGLESIEAVDLTGTGDNILIINALFVGNLNRTNSITVMGNDGDVVEIAEKGWTKTGTVTVDGITYNQYQGHGKTLLAQEGVTVINWPELSINDVTVDEGDSQVTFEVVLSDVWKRAVTFDYTMPDGSTGSLTIAAGDTSISGTVDSWWSDDGLDEDDETLTITISNVENAAEGDLNGTLTIVDNDDAPTLNVENMTVVESDGSSLITFTLSAVSGKEVSVDYTGPNDISGTVVIAAGEFSGSFNVTWDDDSFDEVDEVQTFTLVATNAILANDSVTLTITDDDLSSLTGFNGNLSYTEGDGAVVIDSDAVFSDIEGLYTGGTLSVTGHSSDEIIAIRHQGTEAGQIGIDGSSVTYGGVSIATMTGGANGSALVVDFNVSADAAAIDALIQNLTYENTSDNPAASSVISITAMSADEQNELHVGSYVYTVRTGTANPFNDIDAGSYSAPAFVDVDGDGDLDLIVGAQSGNLNYYENTDAGSYIARTSTDNPFDGINVGSYLAPTFVDVDGDGDLDMVVGDENGNLNYFENTDIGSYTARTGAESPFDAINNIWYNVIPAFGDVDGDGDLDMVVGESDGTLNYYENTGSGSYTARTGVDNPFDGIDVGDYSAPALGDVDGDGDLDLVVGEDDGTLNYYENSDSGSYTARTGADNPFNGIDVGDYSAPAFGDVDGDGDLDLLVGVNGGTLTYYENVVSSSFTVTLNGVNDAPTATNATLTTNEDTAHTFAASDFGYSDVEGDSLVSIRIDTLAVAGSLALGETAVTAEQVITLADIPNLTFTPAANANGAAYADFTFSVNDGTAWSETPNTITFDVAAVNDEPFGYSFNIDGSAIVGETLTATLQDVIDADGIGTISYQWQRGEVDISGATSSTYVLTQDDLGAVITAVASYTDDGGTAESITSSAISNVVAGVTVVQTVGLSSLDSTQGMVLNGVVATDQTGWAVSSAGDVNGDGYDDVIVGAVFADPNSSFDGGASYVVYGSANPSSPFDLSSLDGSNGFMLNGSTDLGFAGYSVSSAGDVNGDGYDDLIVGAIGESPLGRAYAGESYIVYGGSSLGATINLASLNGTDGVTLQGAFDNDYSGNSVSAAGDVNGDGYDDVIVGAPYANGTGGAFVVFGEAGLASTVDLSALSGADGFAITGIEFGDNVGYTVSGTGDINGDGYSDLIIGANAASPGGTTYAGETYVVFGSASPGASFDLSTLDGSNGFTMSGIDVADFSATSVANAGDVNGDGYDDLIIGAYGASPNGTVYAGEAYVVFGSATPTASVDLSALDGTDGYVINGISAGDGAGFTVSSAGDVNGDGYDDVIIGANTATSDGNAYAGESYVVYGSASSSQSLELSAIDGSNGFTIQGASLGDSSGHSVSSAGDVNGDGFDDIIVGAPYADPGSNLDAGSAYVIYGSATSTDIVMGTAGNDALTGNANANHITGREGNDTLTGNGGADVFVFDAGFGDDTILDFEQGIDLLDFRDYLAIDEIADLTITQVSGDTVIDDGNGNTITLTGFVDTLTVSDFDF